MAAISPNVVSGPYTADGTQAAFPFGFSIVAAAELAVEIDGAAASPALYTVAFGDTAGTVMFNSAPAAGAQILILSTPDFTQASSFENQGAYNLSTVNTINRRGAIRDLVLEDKADRALKVPRGEHGLTIPLISDRADRLAAFDNDGDVAALPISVATLSTLAGLQADITAIASNIEPIGVVAADLTGSNMISTVATNVTNVNMVGGSIVHVDSVANALTNLNAVAGALTNIGSVATNIANVNAVGGSIASINAITLDMGLGTNNSYILRAPQAAIDAALSAGSAAAYAAAFGGVFGAKSLTYGFAGPIVSSGTTWPAGSTQYVATSVKGGAITDLYARVTAVGSGAYNIVIASGTNPGSILTFIAGYPLSTVTTVGLQHWTAAMINGGTPVIVPAGCHILLVSPAGGVSTQHEATAPGYTEYSDTTAFTSGTKALGTIANRLFRARVVIDESALQIPRTGLVDKPLLDMVALGGAAAANQILGTKDVSYGATMAEFGNGAFGNNQVGTIGTVLGDGPLNTLMVDYSSPGSSVINLLVLSGSAAGGATADYTVISTTPLSVPMAGGHVVFTSADFGSINLLAGQTLAISVPPGGPTLMNLPKPSVFGFYYGSAATLADGAGRLQLVAGRILRVSFSIIEQVLRARKENLANELVSLSDIAVAAPSTFYLIPTMGQSNMQGTGPSGQVNPATVQPGIAYQYYNGVIKPVLSDPVGNAAITSCLPAFAKRFFALTGCGVIFIPSAIGGSGLAVNGITGNWTPPPAAGAGTLSAGAAAGVIAAKAAVEATASFTASISGTTMTVTGMPIGVIYPGHIISGANVALGTKIVDYGSGTGAAGTYIVDLSQATASTTITQAPMASQMGPILWALGETDADAIDASAPNALSGGPMTGQKHEAAFGLWLSYIQTQLGLGADLKVVISRVGMKQTGDTAGFAAIRAAQANICRTYSNVFMGWTGALNLAAKGEIHTTYHYSIDGYTEMGIGLATTAAYCCLGRI